jgi:membrane protein
MKKIIYSLLLTAMVVGSVSAQKSGTKKINKMNTENRHFTFKLNDNVVRKSVTFKNRYGITLAGDLYLPKNYTGKLAAIAISGPFGAVKEQSSGLYAQEMASRGFATLAFDPSYTGESSGEPRNTASPDINTEDFSAAIDFLGNQSFVDRERLGIIGICGFGGMALNTVAVDTRVKAVATTSLYDMSRSISEGVGYKRSKEERKKILEYLNAQRWEDAKTGKPAVGPHEISLDEKGNIIKGNRALPETLPANPHPILAEFFDYYRTPRGYHKNSINSNTAWNATIPLSFMNFPMQNYIEDIAPRPMLLIAGENAHSRYFSEDVYKAAKNTNSELIIIPNTTHVDLYDNKAGKIPFSKLEDFFKKNLK